MFDVMTLCVRAWTMGVYDKKGDEFHSLLALGQLNVSVTLWNQMLFLYSLYRTFIWVNVLARRAAFSIYSLKQGLYLPP